MTERKPSPPNPSSLSSYNPLNNIIIDKKNEYVITEDYVITHRKKGEPTRRANSFYLSENISDGWRRYCELTGESTYLLTEAAFIEFMQNHPIPQMSLNVTRDLITFGPTVKDRLRNKIITNKIQVTMKTLQRIQELGKGDEKKFRDQLEKQILQATRLKRPDSELMSLIEEAEQLL